MNTILLLAVFTFGFCGIGTILRVKADSIKLSGLICFFAFIPGLSEESLAESDRITVPFNVSQSGHIFIAVSINLKEANLLVDTAAGASVIHTKHADFLGLLTLNNIRNIQVRGLGTSNYAMKNVEVPYLFIDDVVFDNPHFIALDLSHIEAAGDTDIHGILGQSFLRNNNAIIDYEQKTISFTRPMER